jgi:hypothetical protein
MKTLMTKVDVKNKKWNLIRNGCCEMTNLKPEENEYSFLSDEFCDIRNLHLYYEKQIPENMGEFRKLHNISSKELLEWLNENYK